MTESFLRRLFKMLINALRAKGHIPVRKSGAGINLCQRNHPAIHHQLPVKAVDGVNVGGRASPPDLGGDLDVLPMPTVMASDHRGISNLSLGTGTDNTQKFVSIGEFLPGIFHHLSPSSLYNAQQSRTRATLNRNARRLAFEKHFSNHGG